MPTAATSTASPSPCQETTLRTRTSPTGEPARSAAIALTSTASASPISVPPSASTLDSATVKRELLPTRAVPGESAARRREVGTQGHRGESARAKRSAAASPPTIPSLLPAARLVACASRSSSTGATRSKLDETACSSDQGHQRDARGEIVDLPEAAAVQERSAPPRRSRVVSSAGDPASTSTPSARKRGGGGGRWYPRRHARSRG